MSNILIIDDEAIIREPVAAALRSAGHQTFVASNGKEGFALINEHRPDVILLDLTMPEMDGIAFLTLLRADAAVRAIPVILLTGVSDKEHIIKAAKLGVQQYILKSRFSLPELLTRIEKCQQRLTASPAVQAPPPPPPPIETSTSRTPPAAPAKKSAISGPVPKLAAKPSPPPQSAWPKFLTREQTLEKLDAIAGGKSIAGVVAQLIAMAGSPNADLNDIVRILNTDPILASRVLQLANSPAFATKKARISTVEEATRNIGIRGIQNMAMAVGIFGAFPPDESDGFNTLRSWQHSFAVAELMALFIRERNPHQEGLNHLVGLCHDLGEILLRQHFSQQYAQILEYAQANGLQPAAVESIAFGIRRPELISRILSRIGLPVPVVHAIREYYERQIKDQAAGMSELARALIVANNVAHGLLLAASLHETIAPITRPEWRIFAGTKDAPTIDPVSRRNEIITATNLLARLPAKDEERLLTPLIPRRALKIIYLRPPTYVELDPVAYALGLVCDATVATALPTVEELSAADGLVVTALHVENGFLAGTDLADLCAAAGRAEMPILALLNQPSPIVHPARTYRTCPVALSDLNDWLLTVQEQTKKSPAISSHS